MVKLQPDTNRIKKKIFLVVDHFKSFIFKVIMMQYALLADSNKSSLQFKSQNAEKTMQLGV